MLEQTKLTTHYPSKTTGGQGQTQAATATFGSAGADEEGDLLAAMD